MPFGIRIRLFHGLSRLDQGMDRGVIAAGM